VRGLADNLSACLAKAHHARVSASNLAEFFAEYSFRYFYGYKILGRRFYTLLQTILK